MPGEVRNNRDESRYELESDGALAIAAYDEEGGRVVFTHTVVPEELEGRGIGTRLVAGAMEDVRRRGLKAVALCSFVARYMERHSEVRDLLAD